jgi:hypothetical protein
VGLWAQQVLALLLLSLRVLLLLLVLQELHALVPFPGCRNHLQAAVLVAELASPAQQAAG